MPSRGGGIARHLRNLRLLGVSIGSGALFFTFVGAFTYVTYRLEEPPFSYSVAAASLVFVLWLTGLAGRWPGRARRPRRVAPTRSRHGRRSRRSESLLTLSDVLPLLVLGLALRRRRDVHRRTPRPSSASATSPRVDRGAATALYFGIYYAGGALGAYLPGLAWQEWGWGGVAATGIGRSRGRRRPRHRAAVGRTSR